MQKLENLLNSLIQRGWKPFENSNLNYCKTDGGFIRFYMIQGKVPEPLMYMCERLEVPLLLIPSIESGLWQFICENNLLSDKVNMKDYIKDSYWFIRRPFDANWEYRIMKSTLYSEKNLPQFLVDNIKVEC